MREIRLILIVISVLFIVSCKKENKVASEPKPEPEPESKWMPNPPMSLPPDTTVDIYVAGNEKEENGDNKILYWTNGNPTIVGSASNPSDGGLFSIEVKDNDVFTSGIVPHTSARYWQNGNPVILNNNSSVYSTSTAMAIEGGSVYVLGQSIIYSREYFQSVYWKNGELKEIDYDLGYGATFNSIAAYNNECYIVGSSFNNATCWKNGQAYFLDSTGTGSSTAWKVSIFNGDVYVAGADNKTNYGDTILSSNAVYWKNNMPVVLDNLNNTTATGIFVAGNDVYACGWKRSKEANGYHYSAVYWKNGQMFTLTDNISEARSIVVVDNHVYICGAYEGRGAIWIDGALFYNMGHESYFADIKVVKK